MSKAKKGDTVKVHYTAKLNDGSVFDTSRERDPITVVIGGGELIPDFENHLVDMKAGDKKEFSLTADRAYGQRRDDLVVEVEKDRFPDDVPLETGQMLEVSGEGRGTSLVTIVEVGEASVTVDGNHPLAGKDITFEVELVSVGA